MNRLNKFAALGVCTSLLFAGPAAAAGTARAQAAPSYSSWVALSALASPGSSQALCGAAAGAAAAAAAAQPGVNPGCVLPAIDAPPPVPVADAPPVVVPAAAAAGGGIGIIPLLLGLAAVGGLAAALLGRGNGNEEGISPR